MILFSFLKYLILNIRYTRLLKKVYKDEQLLIRFSQLFGTEFRIDWVGRIYAVINPNIFKDQLDLNTQIFEYGENGVLLLNRILTVRKSMPLSHKDKGWELFTERIIKEINKQDRKIVFILLGNEAKKIKKYLDNPKHLIIEAPHPSPLSAYHGFFGSKIYSKTCEYLDESKDMWRLK